MFTWLKNGFSWLERVFDESESASFARLATACTVVTGCWALVHIVLRTHHLPDPAELLALGAWMTSPYAINKVAVAWNKPDPGRTTDLQASASDSGRD